MDPRNAKDRSNISLSADKLRRIRDLAARLVSEFEEAPTALGSLPLTAMRGSQVATDLNFKLSVRFVTDAGPRTDGPPSGTSGPLSSISPDEVNQLRTFDKQVIDWIAGSPSNGALFILDPMRAIQASGAAIDKTLIKRIHRIRNAQPAIRALPPGVRISHLRVEAR